MEILLNKKFDVTTSPFLTLEGRIDQLAQPIDTRPAIPYMNVGAVVDQRLQSSASVAVQKKYGPRALALITGEHCAQPVVGMDTPPEFLDYQKRIRGYQVNPHKLDFNQLDHFGSPLHQFNHALQGQTIRPYIVTPLLLAEAQKHGFEVADWGPHNIEVLTLFNTKNQLHDFLRTQETEESLQTLGLLENHTHIVPKPFLATKQQLVQSVIEKLHEYHSLYKTLKPYLERIYSDQHIEFTPHTAGVMVRPTWGGGNYESFYVREDEPSQSGQISYTLRTDEVEFPHLTQEELTAKIREIAVQGASDEYLLTRFMQVCESPGFNIVAGENWSYVAPPNGQIFDGSMCVGTSSSATAPLQNGKFLYNGSSLNSRERLMHLYSARMLAKFIADSMMARGGRGISGVDTMISGFFENAFAQLVRGTEYEEEAVGAVTLAEVNVRPTQRTMHLLTQLAILSQLNNTAGRPITWLDLINAYEATGDTLHYTSKDNYPLSDGAWDRVMGTPDVLAGINGAPNGVYVIMPPVGKGKTMGMGIMAENPSTIQCYQEMLDKLTSG